MRYREHEPPSFLKPYLKCYWTLQLNSLPVLKSSRQLLAESFEFTFNLGAPVDMVNCDGRIKRISATGITGPMSRPMRLRPTGALKLFGICFWPGGGHPFFKFPVSELVDQHSDVDDLWGIGGRRFVEHILNDCHTTQSRIDAINGYLAGCLTMNNRDDAVTQTAIKIIENHSGHISVSRLARRLGLSPRHLTRKFKERVGMTPKQLCRNMRFKQVYKLIEASSQYDWADVALTCGFYDQSHLINEFKYFTGRSPAAYFSSSPHARDFFTANF